MSGKEEQPLIYDDTNTRSNRSRYLLFGGIATLLLVAAIIGVVIAVVLEPSSSAAPLLYESISVDNIKVHLKELENCAIKNGNSRSVMSGYNCSAQYIVDTLIKNEVNCDIKNQTFMTAISTQLSNPKLSSVEPWAIDYQYNVDFTQARYGGVTKSLVNASVCPITGTGCSSSDFSGISNCVVLIKLNNNESCELIDRAMNAQNAGAEAILFYNYETRTALLTNRIRNVGWFENDPLVTIPVLGLSYSLGTTFASSLTPVTVNLSVNSTYDIVPTFNVFCITREGTEQDTIVAGAHLDSVPEGPGLNDNASGSSSLLEIVLQWSRLGLFPKNRVVFAWWGSEEVGLIGSRYYVKNLQDNDPEEFKKIVVNLNFDMLASPNYVPGVHNGSTAIAAKEGSFVITTTFLEYFNIKSLPYKTISLLSGSDFVPFVEAGIPSGGLAAGASGLKTMKERSDFGGLANTALDPCYHLPCDTFENINSECLQTMASAAAYTILQLGGKESLRDFVKYNETEIVLNSRSTKSKCYEECE